jgi:hypothetical protein
VHATKLTHWPSPAHLRRSTAALWSLSFFLKKNPGEALRVYGVYFVKYLKDNNLDNLLFMMGANLEEFLANLDFLHQHLSET